MSPGDSHIKGTATAKIGSGFGSLTIEEFVVTVFDGNGDVVQKRSQTINKSLPPFVGGTYSRSVTFDISYTEVKSRNITRALIQVTGSQPAETEVEIKTSG